MPRTLKSLLTRVRGARRPQQGGEPEPDRRRATTSERDWQIIEAVQGNTLTSVERLQALIDSVRYVAEAGVPGAFAECGVWRGGSVLAMILALQDMDADPRDIYLYDTFEGMTEPTEHDRSPFEGSALAAWQAAAQQGEVAWPEFFDSAAFGEQQVRDLLAQTGYPDERLHLVRGKVEDTIPGEAPAGLALLRLDTDWYESTRHELEHLYPRLSSGGVLIIDDYGHWEGARRAVDEYFAAHGRVLLNRVDYTARVVVKR